MGQYRTLRLAAIFVLSLMMAHLGCDTKSNPPPSSAKSPTVASLVPAATDLLLGMNAGDHLVAVSNFDIEREGTRGLPRVGDYQTINWETLAELRPGILVHQAKPDRLPQGLVQRANDLKIELLNIQIETIDDILHANQVLGESVREPEKARLSADKLRAQLDSIRKSVADKPRIRTLIVRDETGLAVIGRDTFVDDELTIAGGENVILPGTHRYPDIDREMLLSLKPDAIIQLLPGASQQVLDEAARVWTTMPDLPAVKNGRVYVLTYWFVLQPGHRVGDVAQMMAEKLHGISPAAGR